MAVETVQQTAYPQSSAPPAAQGYAPQDNTTLVPVPVRQELVIRSGDYDKACIGSCICPLCGVCGTYMCCATPSGKHGMAQGAKIGLAVASLFTFIVAILVVSKAVTCKDEMTGTNTDYDDCVDISGAVWNATSNECNFNGNCPSKYSFQNTTKDGVLGWCESTDHWTCLGQQSRIQPWVTTAIYIILSLVAAHFAKKFYEERVAASNQGPAIPVYGTPVQPAYAQQV